MHNKMRVLRKFRGILYLPPITPYVTTRVATFGAKEPAMKPKAAMRLPAIATTRNPNTAIRALASGAAGGQENEKKTRLVGDEISNLFSGKEY